MTALRLKGKKPFSTLAMCIVPMCIVPMCIVPMHTSVRIFISANC